MSTEEKKAKDKADRIRNYHRYRAFADIKGVSDYQVSKETGMHNVVLSEWKSGKSQSKIDKLLKIASYLGVSVDKLLA